MRNIGEYRYMSLVLGGFDPVRADAIFDSPAHKIAEAFVSKQAYEFVPIE